MPLEWRPPPWIQGADDPARHTLSHVARAMTAVRIDQSFITDGV